jgi:dephospho-CoA kinase
MAGTSLDASSPSEPLGFAVGLTGGIGSGKTAVADQFEALGAAIIDSDAIAHQLTAAGGAAIEAIAGQFGPHYIAADGALDRRRMRELVFRDPSAKAQLEAILHPRIRHLAMARAAATIGRSPYVMFVVPLLIESGNWRGRVDRILVVDCSPAAQEARVCARSRLEPVLVRTIMAQQAPRADRLDAADDIIVNDGPIGQLTSRVQWLHRSYCGYAHVHGNRL